MRVYHVEGVAASRTPKGTTSFLTHAVDAAGEPLCSKVKASSLIGPVDDSLTPTCTRCQDEILAGGWKPEEA